MLGSTRRRERPMSRRRHGPPSDLVSIGQAARILGVDLVLARQLVIQKKIDVAEDGPPIRLRRVDVEAIRQTMESYRRG
jgi:hypothetical protein